MKNFLFILAFLLLIAPAQAAFNEKPDVSRAVGQLPVANGGTGATSLGGNVTNAGSVLNTTQCVGRTVTEATDTIVAADAGCPIIYNRATSIAVSIAGANTTGFTAGFGVPISNIGVGAVTITPASGTIDGASSFTIPSQTGCYFYSNGTNYVLDRSSCTALPIALGNLPTSLLPRVVGVTVDGGGSVITIGAKGYYRVPFDGTIVGYSMQGDLSGSAVVDVWKTSGAIPTNANSITASATPTLSSAQYLNSTTLTGWATTVTAGDVIGFNVDSASTITRLTVQIYIQSGE